ncbi:MAG: hypothetical protein FI699_00890 [SAR202 cluster bacterium]|nr:hypothetical protein [SAR202 cluster bacterium]
MSCSENRTYLLELININTSSVIANSVWTHQDWDALNISTLESLIQSSTSSQARLVASTFGRKVLRKYSTSFFTVTRFLPLEKRRDVEIIYSAVRYPDEIVDTFNIDLGSRHNRLESWRKQFENSKSEYDPRSNAKSGVPAAICGFQSVANVNKIPEKYYASFLDAMALDIGKKVYSNWKELLDQYIYGSATVVGYFLAHVYGPSKGTPFEDTLATSKNLAIALQLTNFARDVLDDYKRGRQYAPSNHAGLPPDDFYEFTEWARDSQVLLANEAERWYEMADQGLNAIAKDCSVATNACLTVYRRLNKKIIERPETLTDRASLSIREKLGSLPTRKYWILPVAFMKG